MQQVMNAYNSSKIEIEKIAKYVGPVDFISNWLKQVEINNNSKHDPEDRYSSISYHQLEQKNNRRSYKANFKEYKDARIKLLQSQKRSKLMSMIASAVFLTPFSLFYTLPRYRNFKEEQQQETGLLELISSNKKDFLNGTKGLYEAGKLCEADFPEAAVNILSNVTNPEQYKIAMQDCGSILLAHGMPEEAEEFFIKAGDQSGAKICEKQKQGKVTLGELYSNIDEETSILSFEQWRARKEEEKQATSESPRYTRESYGNFHSPNNKNPQSDAAGVGQYDNEIDRDNDFSYKKRIIWIISHIIPYKNRSIESLIKLYLYGAFFNAKVTLAFFV